MHTLISGCEKYLSTGTRYYNMLIEQQDYIKKYFEPCDDQLCSNHLVWMLYNILYNPFMHGEKRSRWMGYVQGIMVAKGLLSVNDERNNTREIFTEFENYVI